MKFFIKITKTYTAKNKLDKAILQRISSVDNTLLENVTMRKYMDDIVNSIVMLNREYSRCTAREMTCFTAHPNIHCGVDGVFKFSAYPVLNRV